MKTQKQQQAEDQMSPTERAARLLGHRIRVEALIILIERVASPNQIARETGDILQSVVYHVKILYEAGAVDLVREEKRGGATEHFYRAARRPELTHDEWLALSDLHKKELAVISVRNLFAESLASIEHGALQSDEEMYFWWKAALFDREGREEVRREQDAHVARLLAIEARSNARVVQSGGDLEQASTVLGVLGFNRGRPGPIDEIVPEPARSELPSPRRA